MQIWKPMFILIYYSSQDTISHSCTDKDFVGVAKPWECRFGSDIHQSDSRTYILAGESHRTKCCGQIIGWEFQASPRAQVRPISFLVWRPLDTSSASFTLISQHNFWYTKERSRTVTVRLDESEYFVVNRGDIIGWHVPSGDVIDYKTTNIEPSIYMVTGSLSDLKVGLNYTFSGKQENGRIYGIKALLTSVQPQRLMSPSRKLTLKCPLEANDYITSIEASKESVVRYSIDGYNPWFSVDELTGDVKTTTPVSGNLSSDIHILATSTCDVQTPILLSFQCIDLDDQIDKHKSLVEKLQETSSQPSTNLDKPVYHVTFQESVTSETTLRVFNFTNNQKDKVVCTLTRTEPAIPANVLYISGDRLLIRSHYSILYNSVATIYANVTCVHVDGHAVDEINIIHIIKDLEPVFENLPALIYVSARQFQAGDIVFQSTVTDVENATLIFDSTDCSCPFSINIDGAVIVSSDLRKTTQTSLAIDVYVSDGFHRVGPRQLNVIIKDRNHSPEFVKFSDEVVIPENKQEVVITFETRDQDIGDNVNIVLSWEDVAAVSYFNFNIKSQQLFVNPDALLDYEFLVRTRNQTHFVLYVSLTDGFLVSKTEKMVIHVADVNEGPRFSVHKLSITHNEGPAGSVILDSEIRMMVTDPDINDTVVFYMLPSNWSYMFSVNRITGQLMYSSDYDTDPSRLPGHVMLLIRVSDSGNLTDVLEISLFIKNVNRSPVVAVPALISVSEDTPGGISLFIASVTDWDTDDRPNISIVCISHSTSHYFIVQSGTLKLHENASLNYEVASVFTFQVQAEDGHTTSVAKYVTLLVTDVNESPVSHRSKLFIRARQRKAGDCISSTDLRDLFSDPDNDTLTYSILKKNDADWIPFMIDTFTGFLYLSHDINVTRISASLVILAWIMAEDPGKLNAQIEVEVTFMFVNTKPVLLGLPTHITLFEKRYVSDVYTVVATDEDEDIVTLRHHSLDEWANTAVSVNISSGEIKLMTCPPLSQGQFAFVTLIITAFDGEDMSDPGVLNITIVGVNDPPRFLKEEYRIVINETQVGQYIASQETWLVDDPDPDDRLTFFVIGGASEDIVYVNRVTGEMEIKEFYDIDLDSSSSLILLLMVIDSHGLNTTTKVILNITDVNDNIPVMENDGEVFVIPPDITAGWRVGQIKARDIDAGKNSELTYNLTGTSSNTTSYLINSRDGWILFSGLMTPEDYVTLSCTVSDSGHPANAVTAVVHVIVASSSSSNTTAVRSDLLQQSNSVGVGNIKDPATFILTGLLICCILVITALIYQLWKMKKVQRMTQPEQGHDAHHDYRFQWVPRQIVEEGHDTDMQDSRSSLNAIPSFLRTSVSNQNFHYEPAVLSQSQELQESSHENQAAERSRKD